VNLAYLPRLRTDRADHGAWERAEVQRSDVEAAMISGAPLMVKAKTRQRYLAPPADTVYPLEYAYHLLGNVAGRRVLDLGCGSGSNSVLLALRGAQVTGVDISTSLLSLAERRLDVNGLAGQARFTVGSAHDLPLPSASFDVVFGMAILHHLDLKLVASETRRVLKPGGRAIFQEPVRSSRVVRFARSLIPYHAPDVSPFERPLTDGELDDFASGFSESRRRAFVLPHVSLGQVLPLVRRYTDLLYRLDGAVLRAFPSLAHFSAIRVIELTR
jgi:SAM-dependent methyltransferase